MPLIEIMSKKTDKLKKENDQCQTEKTNKYKIQFRVVVISQNKIKHNEIKSYSSYSRRGGDWIKQRRYKLERKPRTM